MDWTAFIMGITLLLILSLTFFTQYGLYFRWKNARRLDARETVEDALMYIHQRQQNGQLASSRALESTLKISTKQSLKLIQRMTRQGLIDVRGAGLALSEEGHRWARQVVRAHRLFERYLADETGVPMAEIHAYAHRFEHRFSTQALNKLEADMGYPISDPHGDPIPTADGDLATIKGQSLVDWDSIEPAQIVHIEDEPPEVYAQIVATGLAPGKIITVVEATPERLVVECDNTEHALARVVAANIWARSVLAFPQTQSSRRLTELKLGQRGRVVALDNACQGLTRRRFLDLGITPGVRIEPVMRSAFGEPTAYRVRDTLIALRREQTDTILIAVE
jgi:DtxR family Mn-dependent transcriptional regulator